MISSPPLPVGTRLVVWLSGVVAVLNVALMAFDMIQDGNLIASGLLPAWSMLGLLAVLALCLLYLLVKRVVSKQPLRREWWVAGGPALAVLTLMAIYAIFSRVGHP